MIGFLSGTVHSKQNDSLILVVGGVGYLVSVPVATLNLVKPDQRLDLYIHTHLKEEALYLYGFKTAEELSLFKIVLGVSGIGPKTALAVVDRGVEQVRSALMKADSSFFVGVPRLGQRGAQRMIIELKNKIGSAADLDLSGSGSEVEEVIEALESMGYSKLESLQAAQQIPASVNSLEQKMTFVLRQLGKGKLKG